MLFYISHKLMVCRAHQEGACSGDDAAAAADVQEALPRLQVQLLLRTRAPTFIGPPNVGCTMSLLKSCPTQLDPAAPNKSLAGTTQSGL